MNRLVLSFIGLCVAVLCLSYDATAKPTAPVELNLKDFGAIGDGVTDDGPAFRKALDALAAAGGGTLFVPAGQYVIATPVIKDFGGLSSSITITGVESSTPIAPPTAPGSELSLGLDLPTEIYPRTGDANVALAIMGVRNVVIKEIAFVGTPTARTDALITVFLRDIDKAQIRHCEFYGLSTLIGGGAIVQAIRSDLEITKSKFLGTTATSGHYVPVVQNLEWRGITVSDTIFLDYGQREFFSKTFLAAPISWINIGNAAQPTNLSPRREVVVRNVFLDEGGYWGISSLPYRYLPPSAPIDLIYVTGLYMNVSNFNQFGHQLYDARRVMIEKSRYTWSHNALAAIALNNVGAAILDQLKCEADADHIFADANTKELTVINSTFAQLDSAAQSTKTINTTDEDDPVQYVRRRFVAALGREPDPAAHFYWSDLLIKCEDSDCQDTNKAALNSYLAAQPATTFALSGHITDERGLPFAKLLVTLSGSQTQSVSTRTDSNGDYLFTNLPTSDRYVVTPSNNNYIFAAPNQTFITPTGNRTADFTSELKPRLIKGLIKTNGTPLSGVQVALSGSATATTNTNNAGEYSFTAAPGGNYVVTPAKAHYTFQPASKSITDLKADTQLDFAAALRKHSISGRVVDGGNKSIAGVTIALSGSITRTTNTASDGSYSFTDIDGGSSVILMAAKTGYSISPSNTIINELATNTVVNFQATKLPVLLTVPDSDRALALELTRLVTDPFPLANILLAGDDNRTRIMLFATDLGLLPGDGVEALMAEAEDLKGVRYPLGVEFLSPLPGVPDVLQLVIRLNGELEGAGEVFISVSVRGASSNKTRIRIAH